MTPRYNIRWVENTFTSRALTESLLGPEREAGNISTSDYEAATNFLPGPHRYYASAGTLLSIPLLYAFRKPSWSNPRTYLFLTATSAVGFLCGRLLTISAHFNFIRSIENPEGFSQVLENIQGNSRIAPRAGPTGQGRHSTFDETGQTLLSSSADSDHRAINQSTWDRIRAANSRVSTNSVWETLRQNHQRDHLPSSREQERSRSEDRAAEQAKFDDLLEKERNMK